MFRNVETSELLKPSKSGTQEGHWAKSSQSHCEFDVNKVVFVFATSQNPHPLALQC